MLRAILELVKNGQGLGEQGPELGQGRHLPGRGELQRWKNLGF